MRGIKAVVITVALAGAILAAGPGEASAQVFLSLDGVDGESQDADHRGWIEVQSMSWGTTTSGSTSAIPPDGVRSVTFTRPVDATSPRLAAARTRRIPNATLAIRPPGASQTQELLLSNVRISSVRAGRTTGGVAMETVTIAYEHIQRVAPQAATRPARALTARAARARAVPGVISIMALPGVDGESANGHEGEIEILSWSWGTTASSAPQPETAPAGTTSLTITRRVDAASPRLSRARTQRTRLPEAVLTLRKAGGGPEEYLVIRMHDVFVSSVNLPPSASPRDTHEVENVTLTFQRVDAPTPLRRDPGPRRARARTTATP